MFELKIVGKRLYNTKPPHHIRHGGLFFVLTGKAWLYVNLDFCFSISAYSSGEVRGRFKIQRIAVFVHNGIKRIAVFVRNEIKRIALFGEAW